MSLDSALFLSMQHCILLRDKLVTNVVIRATMCFNLQCNNVARQVEVKCCPYYWTFKHIFPLEMFVYYVVYLFLI